jgi:RNA polymerase sigma-70 factor, ECF subfamily
MSDRVPKIFAVTATQAPVIDQLEAHRRELTGYCYRMLGSAYDAEDAVQEASIRALRAADGFEGRSSIRSWLYRIATNVCLDMLRSRRRRAIPVELGPARPPVEESVADVLPDGSWVSPIADERVLPAEADPAQIAELRESVRLAFVAALQHLPPRQRAALILCDVLRWRASEAAELLDTSVAAVNSALQRARAGLAEREPPAHDLDEESSELLERYVDAFERYDIDEFVRLLHEDAVQTMPPLAMWLRGAPDIRAWMLGVGAGCRGSRLVRINASGAPAFAQYRPDPAGGHRPWGLHVLDISGNRIREIDSFLDTDRLFPLFGLPMYLPERGLGG